MTGKEIWAKPVVFGFIQYDDMLDKHTRHSNEGVLIHTALKLGCLDIDASTLLTVAYVLSGGEGSQIINRGGGQTSKHETQVVDHKLSNWPLSSKKTEQTSFVL